MPNFIDQQQLLSVLGVLSACSMPFICLLFLGHLFAFFVLWIWWRRHLRVLVSSLDDFTRGLKHRSVLDSTSHLTEQIDAFVADVRDVIDGDKTSIDRDLLRGRVQLFDEKRRYLSSVMFETAYNICGTMIESYPLFGILGTLLAMGVGLAARQAGTGGTNTAAILVTRLGEGIWATIAGLSATVILMFINSILEPRFQRLHQSRDAVRDAVHRVKRELSLMPGATNSGATAAAGDRT